MLQAVASAWRAWALQPPPPSPPSPPPSPPSPPPSPPPPAPPPPSPPPSPPPPPTLPPSELSMLVQHIRHHALDLAIAVIVLAAMAASLYYVAASRSSRHRHRVCSDSKHTQHPCQDAQAARTWHQKFILKKDLLASKSSLLELAHLPQKRMGSSSTAPGVLNTTSSFPCTDLIDVENGCRPPSHSKESACLVGSKYIRSVVEPSCPDDETPVATPSRRNARMENSLTIDAPVCPDDEKHDENIVDTAAPLVPSVHRSIGYDLD